jgi:Tol biopolymer transport system component
MSIARRVQPPPAEADWPLIASRAALIAIATLAAAAVGCARGAPPVDPPTLRLSWNAPDDLTLGGGTDYPFGLALSPDGRRMVVSAASAAAVHLWLRDMTSGETQMLPGTDEAVLPFWAPDARAIAFFARGQLKAITLETATVIDLAPAPAPRGGAWHPGGDILFAADNDGGLMRRRGANGAIERWSTPDPSAGELSHRLPALVDEGRSVIFFVRATEASRQGVWIAPLDRPDDRKRLTSSDSHAVASGNTVMFASGGQLVAQPFNVERRALDGRPVLIGGPVGIGPHHQLLAALNADVVFFGEPAAGLRELRWVDRAGAAIGLLGEASSLWDLRIAPTGTRIAVAGADPQLNTLDIWTYDGDRPLPRKISPAIDADESPVWSPDGTRIAWVSGRRAVTVRGAAAELPEEAIYKSDAALRLTDWSPDGQWLVVNQSHPATHDDLWLVPAAPGGAARAYAQSPFNEIQGTISPDGKWLAYASDESGRYEIYVDRFPAPGTRGRLTSGGGVDPRWSHDGAEIYFRRGSEVHAVRPSFQGPLPVAASSDRLFDAKLDLRAYDVSADGKRFLLNVPSVDSAPRPITAIVNWRPILSR